MKNAQWLILIISTLFVLSSCVGGSSSGSSDSTSDSGTDNSPKLTGSLGSGYSINSNMSLALIDSQTTSVNLIVVDQLMAIPISHPYNNSPSIFSDVITSDIASDGTFSISLDTGTDYIITLVNSSEEKKNQIVSYVALGDALDNMVMIPTTHMTDDVNAGDVEQDGDDAVSDGSLEENSSSFDIDLSKLQEIARTDNILKSVKNLYANFDSTTQDFVRGTLLFGWWINHSAIENAFSSPSDYNFYGYNINIELENLSNDDFSTLDEVTTFTQIADKTISAEIVPPGEVQAMKQSDGSIVTYNQNAPFTNDGTITIDDGEEKFAYDDDFQVSLSSSGLLMFATVGHYISNIPDGWWNLIIDGNEVASFELGLASPIGDNGMPNVYMPSLKATLDENDKVIQFEVKWYLYNNITQQYEEITDLTTFEETVEHVQLVFIDSDGSTQNGNQEYSAIIDFDDTTTTIIVPEDTWYYFGSSSTTDYVINSLSFGYRMHGSSFGVEFTQ